MRGAGAHGADTGQSVLARGTHDPCVAPGTWQPLETARGRQGGCGTKPYVTLNGGGQPRRLGSTVPVRGGKRHRGYSDAGTLGVSPAPPWSRAPTAAEPELGHGVTLGSMHGCGDSSRVTPTAWQGARLRVRSVQGCLRACKRSLWAGVMDTCSALPVPSLARGPD